MTQAVDNLELVLPLLSWPDEDTFYYVQILQRKKENEMAGSSARAVNNYYVKNEEHLVWLYPEIKAIAEVTGARVTIRLTPRSFRQTAFTALKNMAEVMSNQEYPHIKRCYSRAAGQGQKKGAKKLWVLDVDHPLDKMSGFIDFIREEINALQPQDGEDKMKAIIPSRSGFHIITSPFDKGTFSQRRSEQDKWWWCPSNFIQRNNPTNLYIPCM
jgi:hypothetical protein